MKLLIIFFTTIFFILQLKGQNTPTYYTPLNFSNVSPRWIHIVKNKEIRGHKWGTNIQDTLNSYGGHFLNWPYLTIHKKDFFYIIYKYSIPHQFNEGLYIEKLNSQTGELVGYWHHDITKSDTTYESTMNAFINMEGNLELLNRRTNTKNGLLTISLWDLDTLDLSVIKHVFNPSQDDKFKKFNNFSFQQIQPVNDSLYLYIETIYTRGSNSHVDVGLVSGLINVEGEILSDTTVYFYSYKEPSFRVNFNRNNVTNKTISISKDTFVKFNYAYINESEIIAKLDYFDNKLNKLLSFDLGQEFSEKDGLPYRSISVDKECFLLEGRIYHNSNTSTWKRRLIFSFSSEGVLNEKVLLMRSDSSDILGFTAIKPKGKEGLLIIAINSDNSGIDVWTTKGQGLLRLQKTLLFNSINQYFLPINIDQMDNGDFLLFATQARDTLNTRYDVAQVSIRLTNEDLGIITKLETSKNEEEIDINVYPNPSNEWLNIEFKSKFTGLVKICDINGRWLLEQKIDNSKNVQLKISELTMGQYFIHFAGPSSMNLTQSKSFYKTK